jgi:hypothetical protein
MDPISAAAASAATTAGTTAATGAYMAAGAGAAQASMLAAQTAGFGMAGTASTLSALGAPGMASVASGLGSLGGLMAYASPIATIGSGLYSAQMAGKSAELEAQGMQAQAFQEGLKAEEESIMRRERLLKALASQNVASGASGAAGITAGALQLESMKEFQKEQRSADLMARTQQDIYRRKVSGRLSRGTAEARGELLTTATNLAEIG